MVKIIIMFYYKYVTGRQPWLQNLQRVIYLLNLATQIKGSEPSKGLLLPYNIYART